jgi:hypothetical protein
MKSIIVKLNPSTQEELYSDISPDLLAFILLEAVINVVNELPVPARAKTLDEQVAEAMDDTDTQLMVSVENLVTILIEHDEKNGVDTNAPQYNIDEFNEHVSQKLFAAMESIGTVNDVADLATISAVLNSPELVNNMSFTATHLGDKVLFTLGAA